MQNLLKILLPLVLALPLTLRGEDNKPSTAIKCVVIDPGHGGYDKGCISADKKTYEKSIALGVALKLGEQIKEAYPEVKVIYTRKTDVFVPLNKRADIANKNKADLFISIHVNSTKGARGTETFTMGNNVSDNNFEISKRENSVILLEEDYSTNYQGFDPNSPESYIIFSLLQNAHSEQSLKFAGYIQAEYAKGPITHNRGVKQAGFLVLWQSGMPSVLTEIGFLSNSNELATMRSAKGQKEIAGRIFAAFRRYYKSTQMAIEKPTVADKPSEHFGIQVFATDNQLKAGSPEFKGRKDIQYFKGKGALPYKYYIGEFTERQRAEENLKEIRKTFKEAFIVRLP